MGLPRLASLSPSQMAEQTINIDVNLPGRPAGQRGPTDRGRAALPAQAGFNSDTSR